MVTQIFNLKQALRLDSEADQEIEISSSQAKGIVYLAIGDNGAWIGFNFSADVSITHEAGELWHGGWGSHCIAAPVAAINNVSNLKLSLNDSYDCDGFDYTARLDDIKLFITAFIAEQKIDAPNHYNIYAA